MVRGGMTWLCLGRARTRDRRSLKAPRFAHEALERRLLLTAGGPFAVDDNPPHVTNVYLSSDAWTNGFREALSSQGLGTARDGFWIPPVDQLNELPWNSLNRISISFDSVVQVAQDDLRVVGTNDLVFGTDMPEYPVVGFAYDPPRRTASWTLAQAIVNDKILINLDADEGGVSFAGHRLDGEWNNAGDTFPSGNGESGGDFCFRVNINPGDVNRNGTVNAIDIGQVRARQLTSLTNAGTDPNTYSVFKDVSGDGRINAIDLAITRANFLKLLPTREPDGFGSPTCGWGLASRRPGPTSTWAPWTGLGRARVGGGPGDRAVGAVPDAPANCRAEPSSGAGRAPCSEQAHRAASGGLVRAGLGPINRAGTVGPNNRGRTTESRR